MALQGATKEYYPGDSMDARATMALAAEYEHASKALRKLGGKHYVGSWAPFRLAALHSIELYLTAFLKLHGVENSEVRSTGHQLCEKMKCAMEYGLSVQKKTQEHLGELTGMREYLVVRYDSTLLRGLPQINRLEATRDEIAAEVTRIVEARSGVARTI